MDWEKLKEFFSNDRMQLYVKESTPALDQINNFLGKKLFPEKPVLSPEVEIGFGTEAYGLMDYAGFFDSANIKVREMSFQKAKMVVATKKNKDSLKEDSINYLSMFTESPVARNIIMEQIGSGTRFLNNILELRNEKEVWDMLTLGTVQTLSGVPVTIPFKDLNVTNIASGICYHDRVSWFNNAGVVNAGADILGDISSFKEWQVSLPRGGPAFTKMIMNSTTFKALLGNTALNTVNIPGMVPFNYDYAFNGKVRGFYDLDLIIYDKVWNNNGSTVKYLPDYYVIFLPDDVGVRFVAPNPENFTPTRYARAWHSIDPLGFWYEVGETSFPLTNTLKTHGVLYVKAA